MTSNGIETFRALHDRAGGRTFVLPNAWDALSARMMEEAGAAAIGTTSAGVSWSLGRPDGGGLTRSEMIEVVRRVARAVSVPVTADVEAGYGDGTPDDVAETVRQTIGAGAVGINLEDGIDGRRGTLFDADDQGRRIAAARAAADAEGSALFINARVDVYLFQIGAAGERLAETIRRANIAIEAGADGIFVPGVIDTQIIGELVRAIDAPLNVMAGPGAPPVSALRELGVVRVSVGPAITLATMALIRDASHALLNDGAYDELERSVPIGDALALFAG